MKVKNGDVVTFLAISWDEPQWDFDYPTVVLEPCISYSPNGNAPESMIEDMAISLCCGDDLEDENVSEEFDWRGWKIPTIHKAAKAALQGKDVWKTKLRELVKQDIQFFEKNGVLEFKVVGSQSIR
jgi:hypothetical protein